MTTTLTPAPTLPEQDTTPADDYRYDPGDDNRRAHIVWDRGNPEAKAADLVLTARINGTPVEALCGHTFVPQRDPKRFPMCEECKAIRRELESP